MDGQLCLGGVLIHALCLLKLCQAFRAHNLIFCVKGSLRALDSVHNFYEHCDGLRVDEKLIEGK